jgi:hypothetical protein
MSDSDEPGEENDGPEHPEDGSYSLDSQLGKTISVSLKKRKGDGPDDP